MREPQGAEHHDELKSSSDKIITFRQNWGSGRWLGKEGRERNHQRLDTCCVSGSPALLPVNFHTRHEKDSNPEPTTLSAL